MDIRLVNKPQLDTYKQFLEAQKMIYSLIPKSKQDMLYKGLCSVLESSIRSFISEKSNKERLAFKKDHEREIQRLIDRISELEKLCEDNDIKHSLTSKEVLGKGYQGGV